MNWMRTRKKLLFFWNLNQLYHLTCDLLHWSPFPVLVEGCSILCYFFLGGGGRLTISVVSLDADGVPLIELYGVTEDGWGGGGSLPFLLFLLTRMVCHSLSYTGSLRMVGGGAYRFCRFSWHGWCATRWAARGRWGWSRGLIRRRTWTRRARHASPRPWSLPYRSQTLRYTATTLTTIHRKTKLSLRDTKIFNEEKNRIFNIETWLVLVYSEWCTIEFFCVNLTDTRMHSSRPSLGGVCPGEVSARRGVPSGVSCDLSHHAFDVTCMLPPHQLRFNTSAAAYIVLTHCMLRYPPTPYEQNDWQTGVKT